MHKFTFLNDGINERSSALSKTPNGTAFWKRGQSRKVHPIFFENFLPGKSLFHFISLLEFLPFAPVLQGPEF